jgi:hypothetical protein
LIKRAWREIDVKEVIKSRFQVRIPVSLGIEASFFADTGKNTNPPLVLPIVGLSRAGVAFDCFKFQLQLKRLNYRSSFPVAALAEERANVVPVLHTTALCHHRLETGLS